MEPLSVTGLVGTCFSLLAILAKTIKSAHDLKSNFREVDSDLQHLLSRISTVQTSIQVLQRWLDTGPATLAKNHQLMITLEQSLDDCIAVVSAIEKHLTRLNFSAGSATAARTRLRHLWKADEIAKHKRTLGFQIQALTLLLQAMQMTVLEQQKLMAKDGNQKLLKQARDDASSYIDLTDDQSSILQGSMVTAGNGMDAFFDFDDLALDSQAYRAAFRSLLRKDRHSGLATVAANRQSSFEGRDISTANEMPEIHDPPQEIGEQIQQPLVSDGNTSDVETQSTISTEEATSSSGSPALYYVTKAVCLSQVGFGVVSENIVHKAPVGMWKIEINCAQRIRGPGFIDIEPNSFIRIKTQGTEGADIESQRSNRNSPYNEIFYIPHMSGRTKKLVLEIIETRIFGKDRLLGMITVNTAEYIQKHPRTGEYVPVTLDPNPPTEQLPMSDNTSCHGKPTFKVSFIPRYDIVIKPTNYEHTKLPPLSAGYDGIGPRTVILNETDALSFDSGFFIFKASLTHEPLPRANDPSQSELMGLMLFVFIDDNDYPSYSRSLFLQSTDEVERIGIGFVRNLRVSSVEFRICELSTRRNRIGKRWGKYNSVTTFRGKTLDILARSFSKPTTFNMQSLRDVEGKTALELSTFYLPAPADMPLPEADKGQLHVQILQAINLPVEGPGPRAGWGHGGAKETTFVVLKLNGTEVSRTRVELGRSPEWNQLFELDISSRILGDLRVSIMRFASISGSSNIGERKINLRGLEPSKLIDHELDMDDDGARLKLRLFFTPDSEEWNLKIEHRD
ncbi:hypothetical protein QBC38DRAFT_448020 [Podospora fimiseda]|uniref:C2 domain-containing protein n=1 Tax=Podospora fimiseda TaxID=252190 RepID=A0AAN7BGA2_9PEZI|nr:hypothetical protein QBC38DRAFT_448020 [Podospora fimiseda]